MRKLRDVLRLAAAGMSSRQVAASLTIGATTVIDYLARARRAGIAWPLPADLTDEALEAHLYPPPPTVAKDQRPLPDWPTVHRELKRPGVTLQLLWEEYRGRHLQGYGYSRFCEVYRAWAKRLPTPSTRAPDRQASRTFRNLVGVMPMRRANRQVKWLCVNPTARATSLIERPGLCSRVRASARRCSVRY
jgi:hypothetical protein